MTISRWTPVSGCIRRWIHPNSSNAYIQAIHNPTDTLSDSTGQVRNSLSIGIQIVLADPDVFNRSLMLEGVKERGFRQFAEPLRFRLTNN